MIFYNVVVYCVLILFAKVVISNEEKNQPPKYDNADIKNTFAELLKTLVKVNEERMLAMEKIIRLQDYMLTKNKLKPDDDAYESMEEEDNRILLDFADKPEMRRTEDETITKAICSKFYLERDSVHRWSSQFLKLACHSHTIRLCESACKKSVGNLCEKFHCNRNTRRDFNTECHENCSNIFEHDEE